MGLQEKPAANSNPMQRVKMYCLNEDGKWEDQGTGHVAVDYLERSEDLGLFVISAEENETLLMHRIRSEDIYRKQEDSIISWRDPEYATELALSFQEPAGCSYIWEHIANVQRNLQFSNLNSETFHSVQSELRDLPAVELSTLPLIHKMVVESGIADQMRLTELVLNDQDFFRKLVEVFRICEDLDNLEGLHMIFRIVKGIILLNSPQIFDKIFGDELVLDIIGSLEYDPEASQVQHHRNFLKEHVVFKEAIPIKDPTVLSKIHQTYRVGFLKDVVLARVLDDSTVANLNSIIHGNNAVVVSLLKDDNTFIQELFARLRSPTTSSESKKNLVYFLHDFCNLSKSLQMVQQLRLFRDLTNEGIFDILKDTLQSQDKRLVLTGTDILMLFQSQDPNLLRSYVVRTEGTSLLGLLVKGMITDFGDDMHCQFLEILRSLLDSHTLTGGQRDGIIEIFYEKHLSQLIDVIVASCPPGKSADSARAICQDTKPEILSNICELLCFCVVHHPYRTKCNLLLDNYLDKVLLLTSRKEKYLVVAAVRFLRTILSRHDEHLISHIIRNNLFKPIVDAFISNGHRYNLLNSAVLDLLEHIRKDNNLKSLLRYLVDSFWKELVKFEYLASVQSLKMKFEQCQENPGPKNTVTVTDPRKRTEERALEKEEEDYFNEDSDEEDTASASAQRPQKIRAQPVSSNGVHPPSKDSPRSGGLVDYDDDDDEDYRPPPRKQSEVADDEDGGMASLKLKRKLLPSNSKDGGPESTKKQRLMNKGGGTKAKEGGVFAALCSTLSNAMLPGKRASSPASSSASASPRSSLAGDEESKKENTHHQKKEEESRSREEEAAPERSRTTSSTESDEDDNHNSKEKEKEANGGGCSDTNNRQLGGGGEEIQLVQQKPKSPPEMAAANGS